MTFKLFGCGLPRSGTSTLIYALRRAGWNAAHGRAGTGAEPLGVALLRAFLEGRDPLHYVPRGIEAIADPFVTRATDWDLMTCWPTICPGFLERFRAHYPDAWVVLTYREPASWLDSVSRWKDLRVRLTKADLPFLPASTGADDAVVMDWVEAYYDRVRRTFADDSKFLEIDIVGRSDAAHATLSSALEIELPWWGVRNAGAKE